MTVKYNGCIRALEELLERPLQWAICLLHCNELPLRHAFLTLDDTASGPDSFTGPIGKNLKGNVSDWPVIKFEIIESPQFPNLPEDVVNLPEDVVNDLSTDQYYAYKICKCIISGSVDSNLQYLEVGPINLSRWLTLACRILRYFVSIKNPSRNLKHLTQFCIQIYFPSWFEIKLHNKLTDGSKNFFNIMKKIRDFPVQKTKDIAIKNLKVNSYFAHTENVLIAILGDEDETIRELGVNKILSLRGLLPNFIIPNEGSFSTADEDSEDAPESPQSTSVRLFEKPVLNVNATIYYNMVNLNNYHHQPPVIQNLSDSDL